MNLCLPPEGVKILSVGELTRQVKGLLDDAFPSVWVAAELSNVRAATSGHIYLTLKDREAQLRACIWRTTALRLRFEPRNGLEVMVHGRLDVYPPHGEYKLIIDEIHPKGLGALEIALRQRKEKLFRLGYFDPARKKAVPRFPRRVALVTSPTGAAVRDILEVLLRRWPGVEVLVCPVRVQGDGAAESIASAINLLNAISLVDVMIVGRGGGSSEELSAFNEECVAHAMYRSLIPVVSAVGHEIDVTIADMVADRRALTPSEAAEIVTPDRAELLKRLHNVRSRLRSQMAARAEWARDRLRDLADRRVFRLPLDGVRRREQLLDDLGQRLVRAKTRHLERLRERLAAMASHLEGLSPLNVLARGYSLTRRAIDLMVLRSSEQVQPGDFLLTYVERGIIRSRVETTEKVVIRGPGSCRAANGRESA